jgi:pimeloyl-ACP methyl ester carboxylesterase
MIHYSVYGFGDPLILQHGFPDKGSTWNTFQRDEFAKRYKVITPTLRGYTPREVPSGQLNYSSQMLASDLLSILDAENIDRAILVGHDVGGSIAQMFTYIYPEKVTALILTNTPFLPTFPPLLEFDTKQQKMSHYTLKYFGYVESQPKNISTVVENFYKENYPEPPYGQEINLDGLVQSVPACIIWGEEDPYFSAQTLDGLERWFSNGIRLVTIPHAGHWSFQDQPRRWNAELESFLSFLNAYTFPVTLGSS